MDNKLFKIYAVNAFSSNSPFSGNPASVVPLYKWLDEETMQKIAQQNNLAVTAFLVHNPIDTCGNNFQIRWFTPHKEVNLCGHGTIASAFVLYKVKGHIYDNFDVTQPINFESKSGPLSASIQSDFITIEFPQSQNVKVTTPPIQLLQGLNIKDQSSVEIYQGRHYLVVFNNEELVQSLKPNFNDLKNFGNQIHGVIITSKCDPQNNNGIDFICRFFAPAIGVDEDPATGSAFTQLGPYWADRLGKDSFQAIQVSQRKGYIKCRIQQDKVLISGNANLFMEGCIHF